MYTLYSMRRSGNCYKVRLALAQLDIPHELVEIDILQGRDPHAGIPRDESRAATCRCSRWRRAAIIAELNAILWYIAGDTPLLSDDPRRPRRHAAMDVLRAAQPRAQSRRRLFLAGAGQGRARVAAARAGRLDGRGLPRARRDGEAPRDAGTSSPPTATPSPTSRSTPTPTSPHQCDYDLADFPAVRDWLDRVAAQPNHVAMDWQPAGGDGRGAVGVTR